MISGPQFDLVDLAPLPARPPHAPYQPSSDTSHDAAKKVAPRAGTDMMRCFEEIVAAEQAGRPITRKMIADRRFKGMQNKVTGRIATLLEGGLIYEVPLIEHGIVVRRKDGTIKHEDIDGSVVLALTPDGLSYARTVRLVQGTGNG